jgi:hypothetical protein
MNVLMKRARSVVYAAEGLCPVCGVRITITGETLDGRLIGSCRDAFTMNTWEEDPDGPQEA